jgi:hypothetical protein
MILFKPQTFFSDKWAIIQDANSTFGKKENSTGTKHKWKTCKCDHVKKASEPKKAAKQNP